MGKISVPLRFILILLSGLLLSSIISVGFNYLIQWQYHIQHWLYDHAISLYKLLIDKLSTYKPLIVISFLILLILMIIMGGGEIFEVPDFDSGSPGFDSDSPDSPGCLIPSIIVTVFISLIMVSGCIFVISAIPAIFLYWVINPTNIKKGIQVTVFFMSVIISVIIYFAGLKDRLPSVADKVTYFVGVCTGPVTVISILL